MKSLYRAACIFLCLILFCSGCRESFEPNLEARLLDHLVVEGFISTNGITSIQVSRTQQLQDKGSIRAELKAKLTIEADNGTVYPLNEIDKGFYNSASLVLPPDRQYRLRIMTADGEEYLSAFSEVRNTPDNKIFWTRDPDGVRVRVSTEDKSNQTKYYKWSYDETWEIRSVNPSEFAAMQTRPYVTVRARNVSEIPLLLNCWGNSPSSTILIASTMNISQDFVENLQLSFIPNGSDKLAIRYSMLLKQYALTKEAYEFFLLMSKNTEKMGSLFDPQPSMGKGNIVCISNPNRSAIGYIVAANAVEKRIFITSEQAGGWKSSLVCEEKAVKAHPDSLNSYFTNDQYLITGGVLNSFYNRSLPICVDCRLRDSSTKPAFW